ncbi:hypothetical protein, partial [Akkermansia muciniphila]|uniref:hypothetical protein n=1 Tax=Akkermansia muciniphila TaxID=239935 RepID=UPI001BFF5856
KLFITDLLGCAIYVVACLDKNNEKDANKIKDLQTNIKNIKEVSDKIIAAIEELDEKSKNTRGNKDLFDWLRDDIKASIAIDGKKFNDSSQEFIKKIEHEKTSTIEVVYGSDKKSKKQLSDTVKKLLKNITEEYDTLAVISHGEYSTATGIKKPTNQLIIGKKEDKSKIYADMGKFKKFLSSLYPSNSTNGYGIYLVACHQDGAISDGGWRIYSNAPEGENSFSLQMKKNESYLKYYPAKIVSTADNNDTPPIPRPQ